MISTLVDLIQSSAILLWAVFMILLVRRVNRLNKRLDQNSIAVAQVREAGESQAVCGCGHHQCFHDETGCGKTDTWQPYGGLGGTDTYVQLCGCKKYTGPEQLPTVIP